MIFVDLLSFNSLRAVMLLIHFILTTMLFWTMHNSIAVTLPPNYTESDYVDKRKVLEDLVITGTVILVFQMYLALTNNHVLSLISVVNLILDSLGVVFVSWMILDGLEWTTYIFILVFCM